MSEETTPSHTHSTGSLPANSDQQPSCRPDRGSTTGRNKLPALFVVVAFALGGSGGYFGGYRVGLRHAASPDQPQSPVPAGVATSNVSVYDFTRDTPCRVVRVVDGDTVDLDVGGRVERFRLIGLDTPESVHPDRPVEFYAKEASLFARNLLEGESVYVRDGPQKTDHFGRRLAYVFRAPDGLFVNLEIVRQGYGRVMQVKEPFEHLDLFLHYERVALGSHKGIWSPAGGRVRTPEEAPRLLGTKCTIEFTVRSTGHDQAAGVMFLNSKADYRDEDNFYVMIGSVGVEKYRRAGIMPSVEYKQKRIRVTGTVTAFRGKPQIVVDDPSQIATAGSP
jgi:micrococcal nuclease